MCFRSSSTTPSGRALSRKASHSWTIANQGATLAFPFRHRVPVRWIRAMRGRQPPKTIVQTNVPSQSLRCGGLAHDIDLQDRIGGRYVYLARLEMILTASSGRKSYHFQPFTVYFGFSPNSQRTPCFFNRFILPTPRLSTWNTIPHQPRRPVPRRNHRLQIAAKRCTIATSEAIGLQRQCSAPPLAEIADTFALTSCCETCYSQAGRLHDGRAFNLKRRFPAVLGRPATAASQPFAYDRPLLPVFQYSQVANSPLCASLSPASCKVRTR